MVILWKLPVPKPSNKLTTFYSAYTSITAFTRPQHLSIYNVRIIQPTKHHPIHLRSTLILSNHLHLGFPIGFPTKTLHASLFSPIHVHTPNPITLLDLNAAVTFGRQHKSWSSSLRYYKHKQHYLFYLFLSFFLFNQFFFSLYVRLCGFGGLWVACLPLVPKFAGSNPAEAVGFLGRKNPQHAFLRRGSKAVGPMS